MNKYGVPAQGLKLLVPKKCDFGLDVKQPYIDNIRKHRYIVISDCFFPPPTVCNLGGQAEKTGCEFRQI